MRMATEEEPAWRRDDEATRDLLELVDVIVPILVIRTWSDEQCQRAEDWAAARHYLASDNEVCVPRTPSHVVEFAK